MEIGCPLVEILVASSLPPGEELLSPHGEIHFSTGFLCYDRVSCVFLFPGGLVAAFFFVFWIIAVFLSSSGLLRCFHRLI